MFGGIFLEQSPITGQAAGVPFIAVPPTNSPRESAPIVGAWHLMDPPRTEAAFAAALPLDGLDAWRIYLGLPMTGSRTPAGGPEEIMRLGTEDPVLYLFEPIIVGAAAEFPSALRALREQLGMRSDVIGLLGGSAGSSVAQVVLAEGDIPIKVAVLVSPMTQLRPVIDANAKRFGMSYPWADQSNAVADRLDFVARAGEIAKRQDEPPIMMIVGEADDEALRQAAAEEHAALNGAYSDPGRVRLVTIAGMPHALADEPGIEPAPPNANAAEVDRFAVQWFREHLTTR